LAENSPANYVETLFASWRLPPWAADPPEFWQKKTAALKSKPPFQISVRLRLLNDGFFSFAVVRQSFFI